MQAPPAARARASVLSYAQSASYSLTLGMLTILIPFYILSLDYSVGRLGLIISAQGIFQVGLRLFGGVMSDRIGERYVIMAAFAAMAVGSVLMAATGALVALVAAQLLVGGSRSIYWTSAQTYGSRVHEGKAAHFMSRFFGFSSAGQLAGSAVGGVLGEVFGFPLAFTVCAALAVGSLVATFAMPTLPRKAGRTLRQILGPVPGVFKARNMILPAFLAFATSLAMALLSSIIPAFLQREGYSESLVGILRSVHGVGAVGIGFAFSFAIARTGQKLAYAIIVAGNGGLLMLAVVTADWVWLMGALMFGIGIVFNAGRVLYASMTAEVSSPEQRGVAMAVSGIYWAAAQLVGPAIFGPLADVTSIETALLVAGALMLVPGLLTPLLYTLFGTRSTPEPAPAS
jgi:MFS family permease